MKSTSIFLAAITLLSLNSAQAKEEFWDNTDYKVPLVFEGSATLPNKEGKLVPVIKEQAYLSALGVCTLFKGCRVTSLDLVGNTQTYRFTFKKEDSEFIKNIPSQVDDFRNLSSKFVTADGAYSIGFQTTREIVGTELKLEMVAESCKSYCAEYGEDTEWDDFLEKWTTKIICKRDEEVCQPAYEECRKYTQYSGQITALITSLKRNQPVIQWPYVQGNSQSYDRVSLKECLK